MGMEGNQKLSVQEVKPWLVTPSTPGEISCPALHCTHGVPESLDQRRELRLSSSGALRSRGHRNKMLLLFTEAGQLTFPEQKYSWETRVGNLEGKRGGGKGRKAENKCFFLGSLRNGRLISCLQAWRKLRPREDGSLPRCDLESEPLSCQACVFPQFGNSIISSEGERQW